MEAPVLVLRVGCRCLIGPEPPERTEVLRQSRYLMSPEGSRVIDCQGSGSKKEKHHMPRQLALPYTPEA